MANKYPHIPLPFLPQHYERDKGNPKHVPLKSRNQSERKDFQRVQEQQIAEIQKDFKTEQQRYKAYLKPNLIFKLEVTQGVHEESFREEMRRKGIHILAASPQKKGYWVVFASDEELKLFRTASEKYVKSEKSYTAFNAIGSLIQIPPEEKIGEKLKAKPLGDTLEPLDVEIWRLEDKELTAFLKGFGELVSEYGGRVTDTLIEKTFCLLRVKANAKVLKEILPLREVATVDRLPKPYLDFKMLGVERQELKIGKPPKDATAIAVIDSGVLSKQPLIEHTIQDKTTAIGDSPEDDVGHGTKVASVAVYGDLKGHLERKIFDPSARVLSVKVLYRDEFGDAAYDDEILLEHQIKDHIQELFRKHGNFRIVNLSLGDQSQPFFGNRRQYSLATMIDGLAHSYPLLFVVSTGNISDGVLDELSYREKYPKYLLEEKKEVKIINPASSALALTVGSIAPEFAPFQTGIPRDHDIWTSPALTHHPSPFTRVGPGYKEMVKPELVEEGGNIITTQKDHRSENIAGKILLANPNFVESAKLLTGDRGTSFSAPRVTNYAAQIFNQYAHYSPNLVKALLLASARIPDSRPELLSDIDLQCSDKKLAPLLNVYGFGKPDCEYALNSSDSHAMLFKDNSIGLNQVQLYTLDLPHEYIEEKGSRTISISLAFNPPVNPNRSDSYLGCTMEFHLFRNMTPKEVAVAYGKVKFENDGDDAIPERLKPNEIQLSPGTRLRNKGVHQKAWVIFKKKPSIDIGKPLVLVVICQNRWIKDDEYKQDYGLVVTVEHEVEIDLYNRIMNRNRLRARA